MRKVATGLASGPKAKPELAVEAVKTAIKKVNDQSPSAVLLFLTSEFAIDPASAIKAAARAAGCTQVIGCSATGIFTEQDWVLDGPAAAAMVFTDTASLSVILNKPNHQPLLTLAAPNAINNTWLNNTKQYFGGISGDATGHGPFSVWKSGKGVTGGYCEIAIKNAQVAVAVSHGLKHICNTQEITEVDAYDIISINNTSPLDSLKNAWGELHQNNEDLPFHRLVATFANTSKAFDEGTYNVASIINHNEKNGTLTLSKPIQAGALITWAIRDANAAQVDIVKTAGELKQQLPSEPAFGMLFSCLGRGPSFYDGSDQDLELLKTLHPQLPIIGFYGNGEIAPIAGNNELLQYSAVLALVSEKHEP